MSSLPQTRWRRLAVVVAVFALTGAAYAVLRYELWPLYRGWSIARTNALAAQFIAEKDPRSALLAVRRVLSQRPNEAAAWRLGAQAADLRGSDEAVFFQSNLCRVEPSQAHYLDLMRLALKYGAYSAGLDAIQKIPPDARNSPEFHRLAAETYRRIHRATAAKYHLVALLTILPEDRPARLALAEVEFEADPNDLPPDWTERVRQLAAEPAWTLPATVLELRSAIVRRSAPEAAALAGRLLTRADLDLSARLVVVEAAFLYDPPLARRLLASVQHDAIARPDDVVRVIEFLARQSQYQAIKEWYATLAESTQRDERVKLGAAHALEALQDWPALAQLLRGPRWTEAEPTRLGLLAYAYRMIGRSTDSSETWRMAIAATGRDTAKVVDLLRTAQKWHWEAECYDLLWKLFNLQPTIRTLQEPLIAHEYRAGNTVNLNKIYARIIEADPANDDARNNFAYTSLLLDTNAERAREIAGELVAKFPQNGAYFTTYTLALYKQGRPREALDLLQRFKFGAGLRSAPSTALQEAVYAAAAGQSERAAGLLKLLPTEGLLPEERQLAENASAQIAGQTAERRPAREVATGPAGGGSGWLALLPPRAAPFPTSLKLADADYRENNFVGLRAQLTSGRWERDEHLRYALLAYTERQRAQESTARDYWRQALNVAGHDPRRLQDLRALAIRWNWVSERIAVAERSFEDQPSDPVVLAELLDYYRRNGRASDLARLYWRYVERTNSTGREAACCVYYSLLCGTNVTSAQTLAERIHIAAPHDSRSKMAYAFSLWRQQRPSEAWAYLQDVDKQELAGMQLPLLAAGVLIDLGRPAEARKQLAGFNGESALPEEIALAETLSRKIGLGRAALISTNN